MKGTCLGKESMGMAELTWNEGKRGKCGWLRLTWKLGTGRKVTKVQRGRCVIIL